MRTALHGLSFLDRMEEFRESMGAFLKSLASESASLNDWSTSEVFELVALEVKASQLAKLARQQYSHCMERL